MKAHSLSFKSLFLLSSFNSMTWRLIIVVSILICRRLDKVVIETAEVCGSIVLAVREGERLPLLFNPSVGT